MRAQELLDELGICEPEDIDLDAIAQYAGATVQRAALTGAEARIVGAGDEAVITVNERSSPSRQRFSIGHELGHWMYDRGRLSLSCDTDKQERFFSGADKESLANEFAANLLLPAQMFAPRLGKREPTLETVRNLSGVFRTSLAATARRVVELGAYPAMVICSSSTKREWYKASGEIDKRLRPHRVLSKDTLAHELMQAPGYRESTEEVDADAWIDHPDASDYVLVESSIKVTAELVVTVLWWKDQAQLLDLDDGEQ